jgi:hypothetical protein
VAATVIVMAVLGVLAVVAYLLYRLMRWARGHTRGAHVLGAVLTDVTQAAVVHEAKQGKKGEEGNTGDPPHDE